jgi:flagellum-specific peptidoglycan hydrolase FlgJ
VHSADRPLWQQMTALVSLSAGGAITGFSFAQGSPADLTSPSGVPVHLLALEQSVQRASAGDAMLRSAIINVANYYLHLAKTKSPAEMEAIIWQQDSIDGVDHGASCAAFASLALELGAQVMGERSWVTGGTSYPWPLHKWADVRVDPNPASLGVISVVQDAQAHHRWHPPGDGYQPLPGDWVLFDGHMEVVTKYAGGVLHTVGGDSLPNFSVNAHEYRDPLGAQGVTGFVNNGDLPGAASQPGARTHASTHHHQRDHTSAALPAPSGSPTASSPGPAAPPSGTPDAGFPEPAAQPTPGDAAIPGLPAPEPGPNRGRRSARHKIWLGPQRASHGARPHHHRDTGNAFRASIPGTSSSVPMTVQPRRAARPLAAGPGQAAIPGLEEAAPGPTAGTTPPPASGSTAPAPTTPPATGPTTPAPPSHHRHHPRAPAAAHETSAERAFISQIAPGAVAAQHKYGVPASVTIAQAIDESGWGRSKLATRDHNLFGIKGSGPAGSDLLRTQEHLNGQLVTRTTSFRVYRNAAESIDDHGRLLATTEYYRQPMAHRHDPNAFAKALTGVYATDPGYGAKLIDLMRRYDLYRYDAAAPAGASGGAEPSTPIPGTPAPITPAPTPTAPAHGAPTPIPTAPAHGAPTPIPSAPAPAPAGPATGTPAPARNGPTPGGASIPGVPYSAPFASATAPGAAPAPSAAPRPDSVSESVLRLPRPTRSGQEPARRRAQAPASSQPRKSHSQRARPGTVRYQQRIPPSVRNAFVTVAKVRLLRAEPLYRDVASHSGLHWQLLAACDWMQCEARPRYSPVHGEKLGTLNPDGTIYRTKSEALEQCADDIVELAGAVYRIDLAGQGDLSVGNLANAFAAFRWGGLLKAHRTSAMEFPYSVAGLTDQHMNMRWPDIAEPDMPDKPGGRFRMPFGAVPIVLCLNYHATA